MGAVAKAVYFAHLLYPYPLVLHGSFLAKEEMIYWSSGAQITKNPWHFDSNSL